MTNNMKQQYFIGGFTWEGESQLDRFINEGIWVNGYEKDKYADLFKQVKVGDYFALKSTFVKNKQSWLKIAKIGNVTKILNEYTLQVKWLDIPVFEITDIRWYANTLEKISDTKHIEKIFGIAIKTNCMYKEIELLKSCKNLILTGAPGTGKTYKTIEIAAAICDNNIPNNRKDLMERYKELIKAGQIIFTTFHQSLDYEEFIEGLKPTSINGNVTYNIEDGIFKDICDRAKDSIAVENISQFTIDGFKDYLSKLDIKTEKARNDYLRFVNVLLGKETIPTKKCNVEDIPKYDNLEAIIEDKESIEQFDKDFKFNSWFISSVNHLIRFKNSFSSKTTIENKKKNFILIIDEINRGNISKIFGELITLLEKDKRLGEENEITVTLPYSQETFGVPSNLFIIGTMNTADRSIGHIDYAIRRRFAFISMKADGKVIENYNLYQNDTKQKALTLFNDVKQFIADNINADLDVEDLMIGHSYFLAKTAEDLKMRLEYEIIPLIKEYEKDGIIMVDKSELKEKFEEWKTLI